MYQLLFSTEIIVYHGVSLQNNFFSVSFSIFNILLDSFSTLSVLALFNISSHPAPTRPHPTLTSSPAFGFFQFEIMRQKDVVESWTLRAPFVSLQFLKIYKSYCSVLFTNLSRFSLFDYHYYIICNSFCIFFIFCSFILINKNLNLKKTYH